MSRSGILAAGNWIVDHVKLIDEFPKEDALVSITSESDSNGGGPYNVLKNLARLGAPFPLSGAGLVGEDADGTAILADCDALGIDRSRIERTPEAPTSYTDVMTVSSSGRRTFFHQRGANSRFDGSGIDFAQTGAKFFYLGYLLLLDSLDELQPGGNTLAADLLERAGAAGCKTAVDLVSAQSGKFREVVAPALPHVDYLFVNEYEAGSLLDDDLEVCNRDELLEAAERIRSMGVRELVIIHRPDGAVVSGDGVRLWQGSIIMPEDRIAGAVGAGDAFAAGMLLGLHEEQAVEDCLRQAVCCAALCLTDPTTSGGMSSVDDALALADEFGFLD